MKLEFQPISSVVDVEIWHPIVELITLFNGSCAIDDLDWDEDELLRSLVESEEDPHTRADYAGEPATGIQIAKDRFLSDLAELMEARQDELRDASPFVVVNDGEVLLGRKPLAEASEAALAYSWLTLFWVISSQTDYLIIRKEDRDAFLRLFANVFEWICCLVVKSRHDARVWYLGDSRDVREFLRRLINVVEVIGNGSTKTYEQLERNQTGANDAGVDVVAIQTRDDAVHTDSTAYLVGVTIQKSSRRNKIIGIDQVHRFTNYFQRGPTLAYQGMLAIPFEGSEAEAQDCRDRNCLYLTKPQIIKILSRYPTNNAELRDIRVPRQKMRRKSRELRGSLLLRGKSGEVSINWG